MTPPLDITQQPARCPHCGRHMLHDEEPIEYDATRRGYRHVACASAHAA